MPKARPPFDVERYTRFREQGMSNRQITKEIGMPEATLRNNLRVLSTQVERGTPSQEAPRGTQKPLGAFSPGDLADLQDLLAWWRQRQAHAEHGTLVRHTFHVDERWVAALRREADLTHESYAAVLNRALAQYFARGT